MKYLLDTNTIVRYLNGRAPNVRVRMAAAPVSDLTVSTIVKAELRYGAAKSKDPAKATTFQNQFLSLISSIAFDDASAEPLLWLTTSSW